MSRILDPLGDVLEVVISLPIVLPLAFALFAATNIGYLQLRLKDFKFAVQGR